MAETKTVEYGLKINNADDARKAVEDLKNGADEAGKSFKSLDQIIEEGSKQLAILSAAGKKNTKEFEELAKVIGELQKNVDVANSAIDKYAENTDNKINESINVFETGTSVIGLFSSALVALDSDENKLSETTEKLIAIQTTLNSLQSIQANLMNKSSGTYRTLHKVITLIIGDKNKEIVATTKLGKVFNIATGATKGLTTGMKFLRGAIISTGIGLLVVAVGELIANWDTLKNKIFDSIPGLKTVGEWFSGVRESISKFFGEGGKSAEEIKATFDELLGHIEQVDARLVKDIEKAKEKYKEDLVDYKKSAEEKKEITKKYYKDVVDLIDKHNTEIIEKQKKSIDEQLADLGVRKALLPSKKGYVEFEKYDKFAEKIRNEFIEKVTIGDKELSRIKAKYTNIFPDIVFDSEKFFKEHKGLLSEFTKDEVEHLKNLSKEYKRLGGLSKDYITETIELERNQYSLAERREKINELRIKALGELNEAEKKAEQEQKKREEDAKKKLEERYKKEIEVKKKNAELDQKLREAELERLRLFTEDEKKLLKEREENLQKHHQDQLDILKDQLKKRLITQKEYNEQEKIAQKEYNVEFYKIVTERIKLYQQAAEKELQYLKELREEELSILSSDKDLSNFFELGKVEKAQEQFGKYSLKNLKKIYSKYTTEQKMFIVERQRLELEGLKQERDTIETNTKITGKERIRQLTLLNKQEESLRKQHALEILEFDKESNKNFKTILEERRDTVLTLTEQTLSTAANITSSIFELIDANIQRTMDKISESIKSIEEQLGRVDRNINRHINRLTGYYEALSDSTGEEKQDLLAYIKDQEDALNHQYNLEQQLEKKKYEKEKELKREENRQKKVQLQNQLIQAIITGATATLNGFATQPFLPVGVAMGALASTLSAIQIGVISSNIGKIKYAEGGMLNGPSHSNGGIPVGNTGIEVEGGEYVVNKKATKRFLPILEQINDYGRSTRKFANGGQMNLITESDKTSTLLDNINFSPVVSVVDINRENNRLSKVRVLSQI